MDMPESTPVPPAFSVALPYPFGAKVVVDNALEGRATGYWVHCDHLEIEVSWFHNGASVASWFESWRVKG